MVRSEFLPVVFMTRPMFSPGRRTGPSRFASRCEKFFDHPPESPLQPLSFAPVLSPVRKGDHDALDPASIPEHFSILD